MPGGGRSSGRGGRTRRARAGPGAPCPPGPPRRPRGGEACREGGARAAGEARRPVDGRIVERSPSAAAAVARGGRGWASGIGGAQRGPVGPSGDSPALGRGGARAPRPFYSSEPRNGESGEFVVVHEPRRRTERKGDGTGDGLTGGIGQVAARVLALIFFVLGDAPRLLLAIHGRSPAWTNRISPQAPPALAARDVDVMALRPAQTW